MKAILSVLSISLFCFVVDLKSVTGCACTREYDPVCGFDGYGLGTYDNPCLARCAEVKWYKPGSCFDQRRGGVSAYRYRSGTRGCACPRILSPVCAARYGGTWKTYSNSCLARCVGATNIVDGPCPWDTTYF